MGTESEMPYNDFDYTNIIKKRERDSYAFPGGPQKVVDDWLKHYDRVGRQNL